MPTFLLVDDDLDDQEVFKEALEEISTSIVCLTALNGEDALIILESNPVSLPDYIFMDINMPRMNGKQCLTILKNNESWKGIPVVIYTTSYQEKDKNDTKTLGASDYLTKPTSISELRKNIEWVMSQESNFY